MPQNRLQIQKVQQKAIVSILKMAQENLKVLKVRTGVLLVIVKSLAAKAGQLILANAHQKVEGLSGD